MKPRLKIHPNGKVSLIAIGVNAWTEEAAKAWHRKHYGSLAHFSRRYGFDYLHVLNALDRRCGAIQCAGGIADVRQMLGLKSIPSVASIAQVQAQRKRWANRFVPRQSARAPERLDRQSASAGCAGDSHISGGQA